MNVSKVLPCILRPGTKITCCDENLKCRLNHIESYIYIPVDWSSSSYAAVLHYLWHAKVTNLRMYSYTKSNEAQIWMKTAPWARSIWCDIPWSTCNRSLSQIGSIKKQWLHSTAERSTMQHKFVRVLTHPKLSQTMQQRLYKQPVHMLDAMSNLLFLYSCTHWCHTWMPQTLMHWPNDVSSTNVIPQMTIQNVTVAHKFRMHWL